MIPFSLQCTTCKAALRVTNRAAIGQILPCPKCESMVHVAPPLDEEPKLTSAAVGVGAGLAATVGAAQAVGEGPPIPFADRIDEIAADAAALVSGPPTQSTPPPLPIISVSPPATSQIAARWSGFGVSTWTAATWKVTAGGLVAVGLLAASAWWYLSEADPPITSGLSSVAQAAGELNDATVEQADSFAAAAAVVDQGAGPETSDNPNAGSASKVGEPPDEPTIEPNHVPSTIVDAAGSTDTPNNAESELVGDSQPAGSQPAGSRAAGSQAAGSELTASQPDPTVNAAPPTHDERLVRKPSLLLQDLPETLLHSIDPARGLSTSEPAGAPADLSREPAPAAVQAVAQPEPEGPVPLRPLPPEKVDVLARLAIPIAGITFRDAPLHEAAKTIGDLAGVTISLDVDALYAAGIGVAEPINITGSSLTIGAILEQALAAVRLKAQEQDGQLVIRPKAAAQSRQARYAVDDLVRPGDPPIADLTEMVRQVVGHRAPSGDKMQFNVADGAIVLSATEVEHDRMIELCEKLRVARGRPLRSRFIAERPDPRFDPRRFELATRRAKAQSMLGRPITAGIGRTAPLSEVVNYLAAQSGATILIDGTALARAGFAVKTEARLVAAGEPLAAALASLLDPLQLAYRVVDENVIEITSPQAIADRPSVEFYRVSGLSSSPAATTPAVDSYRERVVAATGLQNADAMIAFDPPSQCLIVSAAYPHQVLIEQVLPAVDRP